MVSNRCKLAVKDVLMKLGLHFTPIVLGEVEIMEELNEEERTELKTALSLIGLELMDDKKADIIAKMKVIILDMIRNNSDSPKPAITQLLSESLNLDYKYLAALFGEVIGTTIEQYMITNKIEYVKELIIYSHLNITEIAWKLNYSSVAHLSNQFKKMTGLTPTAFKNLLENRISAPPEKTMLTLTKPE